MPNSPASTPSIAPAGTPPSGPSEPARDRTPPSAPGPSEPALDRRWAFPGWAPALALLAVVALGFAHAWRQRWLCDDAFISFRYARQLADGYGLVFNRGERVEGYTNFLWVLEMTMGMLVGAGPERTSVVLSGLASLGLAAVVVFALVRSPLARSWWPAIFGLFILALNRSVAVWATSGLETRQFTLLGCLAVVLTGLALNQSTHLPASHESRAGPSGLGRGAAADPRLAGHADEGPWWRRARFELWACFAVALAEATRPEGGLIFASLAGVYLLLGPIGRGIAERFARRGDPRTLRASANEHRLHAQEEQAPALRTAFERGRNLAAVLPREAVMRFLALVVPFVVLVGAHYVFRRAYYGDWLPNTYYAKHVRPWTESGDRFFAAAILEHGVYLLLPLAVVGAVARFRRGDVLHAVSFAVLVPHMLYVRRIGGDHFEFRPLDLHWPLLTAAAIDGLLAIARLAPRAPSSGSSPDPSSTTSERANTSRSSVVPSHYAGWLARATNFASRRAWVAGLLFLALAEYSTVLQRAYEHEAGALTTRKSTYKLRGHLTQASTPELRWLMPAFVLRAYNAVSSYCVEHQSCARQGEHKAYWNLLEEEYGRYRTLSRDEAKTLPADATWARAAVGLAPYMFPGVTVIDEYGLTDRTIARTPVDTPNDQRTMAHDRRPPPGYLQSRGVNIEIGPASRTQGEALRYAYWAVRVRSDMWIPFLAYSGDWVVDRFASKALFSQFAYHTDKVFENLGWIEGHYRRGFAFVGRFDTPERDGWKQTSGDPIGPLNPPNPGSTPDDLGHVGTAYLSTSDLALGDRARARFVSPPFTARGHLVFLLAGGGNEATSVRLTVGGTAVRSWPGRGARAFELQSADLADFAGQTAQLELTDDSTEASIAIDQVMLVEPVP